MTLERGASVEKQRDDMSLHRVDASDAPKEELLCIFGTGDLGRSLGQRLLLSGYRVVYGSRRPNSCGPLPQGAQVMTHQEAAQSANMIFVCVHREHYDFLRPLAPHLEGKILVDLSNNLKKNMYPEANGAYLQRLVPKAAVVKGLNTMSAWALQYGVLPGSQVYLCGNDVEAKRAVGEMATKLGLTVVDRGSLSAAREIEDFPLRLFQEWRLSLWLAFGLTAFFYIYLIIRDVVYAYVTTGADTSYRIMVSLPNKVFACVSLIMLALCYLPGCFAAFLQLYNGTKYRRFPDWLDRWMLSRKQIGLIALGFAFLHAIYTFVGPLRSRNRELFQLDRAANTNAWRFDSFFALGNLGLFLYILIGLTSLPSVGGALSWREFSFVQSKLGYLTLFICTLHGYLYGWNKFLNPSTYKWYTPPAFMLSLIVPTVVLVLKLIIIMPCVDRPLMRIRQGWERTSPRRDTDDVKFTNL